MDPRSAAIVWIPVSAVAASFALRALALDSLGAHISWLTFVPAVIVAAVFAGLGAGLIAVMLSCAAVAMSWWSAATGTISAPRDEWMGMLVFALVGVTTAAFGDALRRVRAAERQHAQDMEAHAARLRGYFHSPLVGMGIISPERRWLQVNPALCAMLGHSEGELCSLTWEETSHVDDRGAGGAQLDRLMAGEAEAFSVDRRFVRKDGSVLWASVSMSCVRNPDRAVDYFIALVVDVSERKVAQEALEEAKSTMDAFFEQSPAILNITDDEFRYVKTDAFTPTFFGLDARSIVGKRVEDLAPDFIARHGATMRRVIETGVPERSMELSNPDPGRPGQVLRWRASCFPVPLQGGRRGIGMVAVDITESKRVESALRASEARFRALADSAPVGVYETDAAGDNVYLNRAGQEILGLSAAEARGDGWSRAIHPEDRERVARAWRDALVAANGFVHEYRYVRADRATVLARRYGTAIRDGDRKVTGFIGVLIDVTEQRLAEQQLAVASRLAAMTTLVTGIAHEVNNPLAALMAGQGLALELAQASRRRLDSGTTLDPEERRRLVDDVVGALEEAQEASRRIARIVRELAALNRAVRDRSRARLASVVESALGLLPEGSARGARIEIEDGGAPDVLVSREEIEKVVLNLLSNALKATRPGVPASIRLRVGASSSGKAVLEVADQGVGMPASILSRVFDPFFTTRPAGEGRGTGLGLATCHSIVTAHGGTLTVESEVGKGSTFRLELPSAPGSRWRAPGTEPA